MNNVGDKFTVGHDECLVVSVMVPRPCVKLGPDGYVVPDGWASGKLIRREGARVTYWKPGSILPASLDKGT